MSKILDLFPRVSSAGRGSVMLPSFEERSVWVQLLALLSVLGGYFVVSGLMLARGVTALPAYVPLFGVAVLLLVIVLGAGHALAAVLGRVEPPDERDRLIAWRAESRSSWVLGAGGFLAIAALTAGVAGVWVAHLLLASMLVGEVLKLSLQAWSYRRGA